MLSRHNLVLSIQFQQLCVATSSFAPTFSNINCLGKLQIIRKGGGGGICWPSRFFFLKWMPMVFKCLQQNKNEHFWWLNIGFGFLLQNLLRKLLFVEFQWHRKRIKEYWENRLKCKTIRNWILSNLIKILESNLFTSKYIWGEKILEFAFYLLIVEVDWKALLRFQ